MKKFLQVAFLLALTFTTSMTMAQKSGRINVQALIVAMPETTEMQGKLELISKDFQDNYETMQVELNNKLVEYQSSRETMTESIRSLKEKDMEDLNTRMQQFQQSASQEIQAKQAQFLEPIIAKAREAIAAAAKDGGLTVVYDESAGALAYYDDSVIDLLPAVKVRLGITGK